MKNFLTLRMALISLLFQATVFLFAGLINSQDLPENIDDKEILAILYPLRTTTLFAEITGVVKTVHHEMGEQFKKGESLIVLDSGYYWADKQKAKASLLSASSVFKTKHELFKFKSVSKMEHARSKADLQIAEANLSIARKKLKACTIRAPYNGRVLKLLIKQNELVIEGQSLIEILDDRIIRIKFLVPSEFYNRIKIGQALDVTIREVRKTFECTVTNISPVLESNTSTFQVFAEIENSKHILKGGMTGAVILKSLKGK